MTSSMYIGPNPMKQKLNTQISPLESSGCRVRSIVSAAMTLAALLLSLLAPRAHAQAAPAASQTAGCTLTNKVYTCSRMTFQKILTDARSINLEVRSMDRNGRSQLEALASELGKSVAGPGQPADLTFALVPVDTDGVKIGPSGSQLASLNVYGSGGTEGAHGRLIWSETYTGQADMRWPAIVHALLQQFRAEFDKH